LADMMVVVLKPPKIAVSISPNTSNLPSVI
jgi:hypothetical protein